jgi:hypothetical protein
MYSELTGPHVGIKGKPVQIRHGPAAVTGDETCTQPLCLKRAGEGAGSRPIRKSEDLPVRLAGVHAAGTQGRPEA